MNKTEAKYRAVAHMSQAEAARQLGVSRQAVQQVADRYGIIFAPCEASAFRELSVTMIKTAAKHGLTTRQIADVTGIDLSRVQHLAAIHGIARPREQLPRPVSDRMAELAAQGLTVSEVAKELGVTQSQVSLAKRRDGIVFHRDGRSA